MMKSIKTIDVDVDMVRKAMAARAPHFYRCAGGHDLDGTHRAPEGRCAPGYCRMQKNVKTGLDPYQIGAEEMDITVLGNEKFTIANRPDDAETAYVERARAKETLYMLKLQAINDVANGFHPSPDIPEPPKGLPSREYVEKRLADISPWLLEETIRTARFGTPDERRAARQELLDRSGVAPRKKDVDATPRGAVVVLNFGGATLPFARRGKNVKGQIVEGSTQVVVNAGSPSGGEVDDGGGRESDGVSSDGID